MTWTERPGGAGVFPTEHRHPDANEVEHDLDPQDMADAYVELVDQGVLEDDETLDDDWWDEPITSKGRNYLQANAPWPLKQDGRYR